VMRFKKINGGANEVRHPSYPEGDEEETPLLKEAADSAASRIMIGSSHRLDKTEVRKLIKFLERWLETGKLKGEE
jgi:hypothetical protein